MIITYNKQYQEICKGNGWTLFSDVSPKDSLIVYQLFDVAKNSKLLTFSQMYESLKYAYKTKSVRSRCDLHKDEKNIEIITKGTFPRFYIQKNIVVTN